MALQRWHYVQIAGWLLALLCLAATWKWAGLSAWTDPEFLADAAAPFRESWYGLPLVVAVFVIAELVFFPVLVLIFACGLAFGPWLGPVYAMAGAVASAVIPFLVGRRVGKQRLLRWAGAPARKLAKMLERKGIVAVFLVRKIPAPYSAANLVCGASGVSLPDFLIGTALGMLTGVVLITVLGANLLEILADPEPGPVALALALLAGVIGGVLLLQRLLNRRLERQRSAAERQR
jgi:phospholipase D1/2